MNEQRVLIVRNAESGVSSWTYWRRAPTVSQGAMIATVLVALSRRAGRRELLSVRRTSSSRAIPFVFKSRASSSCPSHYREKRLVARRALLVAVHRLALRRLQIGHVPSPHDKTSTCNKQQPLLEHRMPFSRQGWILIG